MNVSKNKNRGHGRKIDSAHFLSIGTNLSEIGLDFLDIHFHRNYTVLDWFLHKIKDISGTFPAIDIYD